MKRLAWMVLSLVCGVSLYAHADDSPLWGEPLRTTIQTQCHEATSSNTLVVGSEWAMPQKDVSEPILKALESGTQRIELPPGSFWIRQRIRLKENQEIVGAGVGKTILHWPADFQFQTSDDYHTELAVSSSTHVRPYGIGGLDYLIDLDGDCTRVSDLTINAADVPARVYMRRDLSPNSPKAAERVALSAIRIGSDEDNGKYYYSDWPHTKHRIASPKMTTHKNIRVQSIDILDTNTFGINLYSDASAENVLIEDIVFRGKRADSSIGVLIQIGLLGANSPKNIWIHRVTSDGGSMGLWVAGAWNVLVETMTINNGLSGEAMFHTGDTGGPLQNIVLRDCVFTNEIPRSPVIQRLYGLVTFSGRPATFYPQYAEPGNIFGMKTLRQDFATNDAIHDHRNAVSDLTMERVTLQGLGSDKALFREWQGASQFIGGKASRGTITIKDSVFTGGSYGIQSESFINEQVCSILFNEYNNPAFLPSIKRPHITGKEYAQRSPACANTGADPAQLGTFEYQNKMPDFINKMKALVSHSSEQPLVVDGQINPKSDGFLELVPSYKRYVNHLDLIDADIASLQLAGSQFKIENTKFNHQYVQPIFSDTAQIDLGQ